MEIISTKPNRYQQILLLLLCFFITSPYVTLCFFLIKSTLSGNGGIGTSQESSGIFELLNALFFNSGFGWALKNSILQSTLSAVLIVLSGLWGAFGLIYLESKLRPGLVRIIESVLLVPILLPSIFIVISCFYVFKPFPFGIIGIALAHLFNQSGTSILSFKTIIQSKFNKSYELALIEGSGRLLFIWYGVIKGLKNEIFYSFLFFFTLCFTSFQIPLLTGGNNGTTLEVLISEKILIENNLNLALLLSLIQFVFLIALNYFSFQSTNFYNQMSLANNINDHKNHKLSEKKQKLQNTELIQIKSGILPLLAIPAITLLPSLFAFSKGVEQLNSMPFGFDRIIDLIIGSFATGLISGSIFCLLLFLICLFFSFKNFLRWIHSYISPSPVIMGLVLFLWSGIDYLPPIISLCIGLSLLWIAGLFRMYVSPQLESLNQQIFVAKSLGANTFLIFKTIIVPQISKPLFYAAGTGALWSVGDFAISQFITGQQFHLSMAIKSLASSYRLESAFVLSWLLLLIGGLCFYFFIRIGNVISKKSFL